MSGSWRPVRATWKRAPGCSRCAVAIDAGPCVQCIHTGQAVINEDLTTPDAHEPWPRYAPDAGFRSTRALPMGLRDDVVGVLTLLHTLTESDARLGQALADPATVGLLHERAVHQEWTVQEQLQGALNSRVIIEQAKGVRAARSVARRHTRLPCARRRLRPRGDRSPGPAAITRETTPV